MIKEKVLEYRMLYQDPSYLTSDESVLSSKPIIYYCIIKAPSIAGEKKGTKAPWTDNSRSGPPVIEPTRNEQAPATWATPHVSIIRSA
jgi:hypothetical protein